MDIKHIIDELTAERDQLNIAIQALSQIDAPTIAPKRASLVVLKVNKTTQTKLSKPSTSCKHGCGKTFKSDEWRSRHEADCANVIRPNGSAPVERRIQ